jgi:hypothetical protein
MLPDVEDLSEVRKTPFEQRKDRVAAAVAIGMELERAMIAMGCSVEECALIRADGKLQEQLSFWETRSEFDALQLHQTARKIAANKGNGAPIQWYLEKINKPRWGTQDPNLGKPEMPNIIFEELDGALR